MRVGIPGVLGLTEKQAQRIC